MKKISALPARNFVVAGIIAAVSLVLVFRLSAEFENPAVKSEQSITGPARTSPVNASIVPLFWRAEIGPAESRSVVNVPLRSVEYFGVQNYQVDSATIVRELTIGMESRGLVRIYHIRPLATFGSRAEELAEQIKTRVEKQAEEDLDIPIKSYPTTTHQPMVEYRVEHPEEVYALHAELEKAMVNYHARDLVSEQREFTIHRVIVSREE